MASMDVVLVHDYLLANRGAERCFTALCDLWPAAPIATLLYDESVFGERLAGHSIYTSRLQRLGLNQTNFKAAMPVMPFAAERLPVRGHQYVLSSSSAFAHGVRPSQGARHVCYCYTPFRYAWYEQENGLKSVARPLRPLTAQALSRVRAWDFAAAQRDTQYVAISEISRQRIAKYWNVDAPIVYPPVDLSRFTIGQPEDFFLVVGELVRHKRVEDALEACRRAEVPVKVVGEGVDEARLRREFGGSAQFLGRLDDKAVASLYSRARALIMPNVEEFGITAVEAQAAGRPVIAARAGGALETVLDGISGVFFPLGDVESLTTLLRGSAIDHMTPQDAVRNVERFSVTRFQRTMIMQLLGAPLDESPPSAIRGA